jgi:hypothetical protein
VTSRAVVTESEILEIASLAVERRRKRLTSKCWDAVKRYGEDYVKRWIPQCWSLIKADEEGRDDGLKDNVFLKNDFIVAARSWMRKRKRYVKVETLFRKLRKLAEYREGVEYVDRRKGIYRLLRQGDSLSDDAGVL